MEKKPAVQKGSADRALTDFMCEFARFLVAAGVNSSRFMEIVRFAYFRAASDGARFRNKRVNQSAIAAMTGLTRAQVRDYSQQDVPAARATRDRVTNIVEGWTRDPAFVTANYLPRRLEFGSRQAPFSTLVRKYGGDVPARSVLRELVRTNSVTVKGRVVALKPKVRDTVEQARLQGLAQSLLKLLQEPIQRYATLSPMRTLNGEILYPATSRKGRILLQRRSIKSMSALLADLQAAGSAAAMESPPRSEQKTWTTRTRIVLISEDLSLDQSRSKANS